MSEKKIGRPKKRPEYNHDKAMQELMDKAVELLDEPYDDRDLRDPAAPSISYVASELHTTLIRARKLLITAEYYSTATSRQIQSLASKGVTVSEIAKQTGLSEASVYSYLPYSKGVYNLSERSLNAERGRMFKKRKQACEQLAEHLDQPDEIIYMWSAILAFQDYPFATAKGYPFKYTVKGWEIFFSRKEKSITKSTVEMAFRFARDVQKENGYVSGPKKLGTFGASYLYPIFLRIGVCEKKPEAAETAKAELTKDGAGKAGKSSKNR